MSDVQHEQILRLLDDLLVRTETGSAPWEVITQHSFGLQTKGASVQIGSRDDDDTAPFEFVLYNAEGAAIEYLASEWRGPDQAPWNRTLSDLYFSAKSVANRVGEIVDDFLDSLDHGQTLKWTKPPSQTSSYAFDEEPF
jgi:hypothetical protein